MLDENISALIGRIYAGVEDVDGWDGVMADVLTRVGGKHMFVAQFDVQRGRPIDIKLYGDVESGKFQDGAREYDEAMHQIDSINAVARQRSQCDLSSHLLVPDPDRYWKDEYLRWNEDRFGSAFWQFRQAESNGIRVGMALHRTRAQGPVERADAALQSMLHGHVINALSLRRAPSLIEDEPTLLLNGRGDVIGGNAGGWRSIERGDALRVIDGRLQAIDGKSRIRLDAALRSALTAFGEGGAGGSVALARDSGPALLATVSPVRHDARPFRSLSPTVAVRLIDPVAVPAATADWRALFGFTRAEARLAMALLEQDGNLRDVAARLRVSHATARKQLAAIFDKAEVRSQVQLIKLLTRLG